MNTASLENCKRLYELSGWKTDRQHYTVHTYDDHTKRSEPTGIPAYDAGYLLRKLREHSIFAILTAELYDRWWCKYGFLNKRGSLISPGAELGSGDTPEDALCLLAIKLFEEGILRKEQK